MICKQRHWPDFVHDVLHVNWPPQWKSSIEPVSGWSYNRLAHFQFEMLSTESLNIFRKATNLMYFSGAAPLAWIKNKVGQERLVLKNSKMYKCFTGIHFAVLILYNSFMMYRIGTALITHNRSGRNHTKATLSVILQMMWNLLSYSLPLLFMINNFKYWDDIPNFVNGFLQFCDRFKGELIRLLLNSGM